MAKQGYPATGSRYGGHPGASGYPAVGTRYGSHPEALSAITITQKFLAAATWTFLGGGSYTPADEGGAVANIDLLTPGGYVESGGLVTEVINLISSTSWPAASSCPFESAGVNGHPCLHPLDITDYFLSSEAAVVSVIDCPTTAKPYTLFYVDLPDSDTSGGVIFGAGRVGVASASTRTWGRRVGVSQYEYASTSPATTVGQVRSTGAVSTSLNICAWHSPGVGQKMSLNNAADDPGNTTSDPAYIPGTGPQRVALFCRPDSTPDTPIATRFCELWLFDTELDAAARTRVYNYLLAKWS